MSRLDQKLREYDASQPISFHMPGHKGKNLGLGDMEKYDITEIDGFDELYEATGILKEMQEELTALYESQRSYLLTNGSTGANLAAICASCQVGDAVIADRNCHRSVHNAIEIRGLRPIYMDSRPMQAIRPAEIEQAVVHAPEARAVVITSPTYEGMIADIRTIADICHNHDMTLIVDAAHGAHFLKDTEWAGYAADLKAADLVVMSMHKTLPVLGQTACLHVYGDRIPDSSIRHYIEVFHTSSPSYLMMAAAAKCIGQLSDRACRSKTFADYSARLDVFSARIQNLKHIRLWRAPDDDKRAHDRGKLILMTDGGPGSGMALLRDLADHGIALEMAGYDYALAMTSIADADADYDRLAEALEEIDAECGKNGWNIAADSTDRILPQAGDTAEAMISVYPPGTPIVCRGDVIEEHHLTEIRRAIAAGLYVRGLREHE